MSVLRYLNPFHYLGWLRSDDTVEVSQNGRFIVDIGEVVEVPSGTGHCFLVTNFTDITPMREAGLYDLDTHGNVSRVTDPTPSPDTLPSAAEPILGACDAPPHKSRREPHPHVTSVAHAGYCVLIDALKMFIRERLYEPTVVYLDKAAEMILRQHFIEQKWLKPTEYNFRDKLPTFLGCKVIWDAPSFRFASEIDPPKREYPKMAHSLPFGTQPMRMQLGTPVSPIDPNRVRHFDAVDPEGPDGGRVNKAEVPAGQSLSPASIEKIRSGGSGSVLGGRKFL